ncbi:MAG: hypothetical protein ABI193_05515 [Minicystis sp.]
MTNTHSKVPVAHTLKALVALVSAVAILGTVTDASAKKKEAKHCRSPDGAFTSYIVAPPACDSPIGICTMGTLTGDLPSSYWFVMDTLVWGGDPTNPAKFVYTGHSVVTGAHGAKMFGSDTGVMIMNPDPTGPNPFVTVVHIVSGTKKYAHVSGQIVASGTLVFSTGLGVGNYTSAICKDDNDDDDNDGD